MATPKESESMETTTYKDNRAKRRRESMRTARALIDRTAKLRKPDQACPACGELFECAAGCLVRDARAWQVEHRVTQ